MSTRKHVATKLATAARRDGPRPSADPPHVSVVTLAELSEDDLAELDRRYNDACAAAKMVINMDAWLKANARRLIGKEVRV